MALMKGALRGGSGRPEGGGAQGVEVDGALRWSGAAGGMDGEMARTRGFLVWRREGGAEEGSRRLEGGGARGVEVDGTSRWSDAAGGVYCEVVEVTRGL